jgi:hypothetical protein
MGSINSEKEKFWREQLRVAEQEGGSFEAFCRAKGLSPGRFSYWRKKLGERPKKALSLSPFIPVEVKATPKATLPDAAWVAEFIVELMRRQA